MFKMISLKFFLVVFLGTFVGTSMAQVTYSFDGTNYENFNPPYDANSKITGSFELNDYLAANSTIDLTASLLVYSFTDGQATRDQSNTILCQFDVTTDENSRIQSYSIYMRQSDTAPNENQHSIDIFDTVEQSGFSSSLGGTDCGSIALSISGGVFTPDQSTWAGGVPLAALAVPTLSFYLLLLMALIMGSIGVWVKKYK